MTQLRCREAFVALATPNVETLVAFYQALLDQVPKPYQPSIYAEFALPGLRLGLFCPQADHGAEFAHAQGGTLSLCLEVTDLEGAIAHLSAIGHSPPGNITTASHGREIYAYDPDGNRLILHQGPMA
jgi:catechol 2,3-dioxygenase-like lactoylglutathione lyase family enzyme